MYVLREKEREEEREKEREREREIIKKHKKIRPGRSLIPEGNRILSRGNADNVYNGSPK